jgi:hypothetical protein
MSRFLFLNGRRREHPAKIIGQLIDLALDHSLNEDG